MGTVTRLQTGYEPPEPEAELPLAVQWMAAGLRNHLKALDDHDAETRRLLDIPRPPPSGTFAERAELRERHVARLKESARALLKVLE